METQEAKGSIGKNIPGDPAIRVTRQNLFYQFIIFITGI